MKKINALVLGFILLAVMAFSAVAATGCGGSSAQPSDVIDSAIANNANTKSGHVDYDVKLDVQGDASAMGAEFQGLLPLTLGISGGADFDNNDAKNPKAQGNISVTGLDKILSSIASSEGSTDASTTMGLNLIGSMLNDVKFVTLDQKLYLNLGGTWYQTDASSATSGLGGLGGLGGGLSSGLSGTGTSTGTSTVDTACLENAFKDKSRFGANNILSNIQDAGTENVNGADARHFKADINLDGLLTQTANAMRDCGQAESAGAVEAGKSQLGTMFKTKAVEMWIDNNNNFVQVNLNLELDPSAIANLAGSLGGTSTDDSSTNGGAGAAASALKSITFSVNLKMSNLNQSVTITKPSGNILNLNDLLSGGLGSSLGGSASGLDDLGGTSTNGSSTSTTGTSTSSIYSP
ncbi:MAG: hypothetical protein M1455_02465 [Actinobacteria bacterium]|nr:hypothetical protein [Actinomycetota bacterium]